MSRNGSDPNIKPNLSEDNSILAHLNSYKTGKSPKKGKNRLAVLSQKKS